MKYSKENIVIGFQFRTEYHLEYRVESFGHNARGDEIVFLSYSPNFTSRIQHPLASILSCLENGEFIEVAKNPDTYEIF